MRPLKSYENTSPYFLNRKQEIQLIRWKLLRVSCLIKYIYSRTVIFYCKGSCTDDPLKDWMYILYHLCCRGKAARRVSRSDHLPSPLECRLVALQSGWQFRGLFILAIVTNMHLLWYSSLIVFIYTHYEKSENASNITTLLFLLLLDNCFQT